MTELLAFAFLTAATVLILRTLGYKGAGVCLALFVITAFGIIIEKIGEIYGGVLKLSDNPMATEALKVLFKVLGITYLFSIVEESCEALGEGKIAKMVEVGGRVEIILLLMPYFRELLLIGGELL